MPTRQRRSTGESSLDEENIGRKKNSHNKRRKMAAINADEERREDITDLKDIGKQLGAIVARLDSLDTKLGCAITKQNEIDVEVRGDGGVCEELEGAKQVLGETQADLSNAKDMIKDNSKTITLMAAMLERQEKQMKIMRTEIQELKGRSMKYNILFHNISEKENEVLEDSVTSAFRDTQIDLKGIEYERIHRLGPPRYNGKPRPIVARPLRYKDTERLLNTRIPEVDKKTQPWISPQYPDAVREKRVQMSLIARDKKKKAPQSKIQLKHTSLYINGQIVEAPLEAPSLARVLQLPQAERQDLQGIKFTLAPQISVKGSTFTARTTTARSLNDVRNAQNALMLYPEAAKASHNIVGYCLPNGASGYFDDEDYGMGRSVIQALEKLGERGKGLVVIITRSTEGNRLGKQRFDIVRDLTTEVCSSYHHADHAGFANVSFHPSRNGSNRCNSSNISNINSTVHRQAEETQNSDSVGSDLMVNTDIISDTPRESSSSTHPPVTGRPNVDTIRLREADMDQDIYGELTDEQCVEASELCVEASEQCVAQQVAGDVAGSCNTTITTTSS